MLFSFIVPVYHVEEYLPRCVESLINQTYTDIEIILVDDGGNDRCPELCDSYAQNDKRIKVIHKNNGGLSDARNAGINSATGDYIIFVDADDYISLTACEKFYKYACSNYDIIIGETVVKGGNIDLSHIKCGDEMTGKEYLLAAYEQGKAPMAAWLNIYRRKFLIENKFQFKYGILHEDEQFTPRVFLKSQRVICTGIEFYYYIIRDNSITTKKDKRKNAKDLYETLCELEGMYRKLDNERLKDLLLDSLSVKYMYMYHSGNLYKHGNEFTKKSFVKRNAKNKKTKIKGRLFTFSPRLYCYINSVVKSISGKTNGV